MIEPVAWGTRLGRYAADVSAATLSRLVRLLVAVPLAAFALHLARPDVPWFAWCGISSASFLTMRSLEFAVATVRRRSRGP